MTLPRTIYVSGRRWFVYHTCSVYVDGVCIGVTPIAYGYGDHYIQSATELLEQKIGLSPPCYIASKARQPMWRFCLDNGILFAHECADVARRKDLHGGNQ